MRRQFARQIDLDKPFMGHFRDEHDGFLGAGALGEEEGFSTGSVLLASGAMLIVGGIAGYLYRGYEMQDKIARAGAPAFVAPPAYETHAEQQYRLHMQRPEIQDDIANARALTKFQKGHTLTRSEYDRLGRMGA